ncbi:MAG: glycosyltransferase family 4 protein [Pseudomonadota bacterium]
MPRICFVGLDNYPVLNPRAGGDYFGGESVQQTLLARAYVAAGWDVHMLVKDHGQAADEVIDDIRVHTAYDERAGFPVLRFLHPRASGILRALVAADADVYYQSCAGMITGLTAWHAARHGRRFVFRVAHDTDCIPGQQLIRFWRDRKLYEYGLKRADFISAQGEHQRELLREHYGLESTPIPMAVELPGEALDGERDVDVLWVNNLRDFKRPELVPELARALGRWQLAMIGGAVPGFAPLYDEVRAQAEQIPNLAMLGAVPYHEVNSQFARARVFVNTSDSEGFPNSFLQAWIRGVPVVSFFDPDGLIARHGLGLAVSGDVHTMARELDALLADPPTLRAMAERCRNFALAHYAPAAVVERHLSTGATPGDRGADATHARSSLSLPTS